MEDVSPEEQEFLELHGWFSHVVVSPDHARTWVNYHTHGLPEHYGQLDFQVVLPINPELLHKIATKLVDRVQSGERFISGMRVTGLLASHEALLVRMTETRNSRHAVLRIVLPDKDGNLSRESLTGVFAAQFQELPD